jgi:hypothetical protein
VNDTQSLVLFLQLFSLEGNRPPVREEVLEFIMIKIEIIYVNPACTTKVLDIN